MQSDKGVKINLREIEAAGYEHLYGIAPVLNALKANIRDFTNPKDKEDDVDREEMLDLQRRLNALDGSDWDDDNDGNDGETSPENEEKKEIKAEAKLAPCLFVQEGTLDNSKRSFRSASKNEASSEIISLAQQIDLNVVEVDKGVLNTLCGNRPHQGFILRCGGLGFTPLTTKNLPLPNTHGPNLWLALDEVVDPQNLGALLRSAYFLGGGGAVIEDDAMSDNKGVGILVCSKNSSPLSPAASAASAGALEMMTVYSTNNLPKLLNQAREDGWRVLGAAAEIPDTGGRSGGSISRKELQSNDWDFIDDEDEDDQSSDITEYANLVKQNEEEDQRCYNLNEVEVGQPTVLVLGSEGKGLRKLVARACSDFVKIPGGSSVDNQSQAGVDSLNVSVSGGIFLFHFCGR
jgi:21S rRNA (GM2251-2'-O)-methyltransferase